MPRRTKQHEQSLKNESEKIIDKIEKGSFKKKYSWDNAEEYELIFKLRPSDQCKLKEKELLELEMKHHPKVIIPVYKKNYKNTIQVTTVLNGVLSFF